MVKTEVAMKNIGFFHLPLHCKDKGSARKGILFVSGRAAICLVVILQSPGAACV